MTDTEDKVEAPGPDTQVQEGDQQDASPSQEEYEAQARTQGWRPKDEYRGTGKWVDAETFLKRAQDFNPILRERLDKVSTENAELKALVKDIYAHNQRQLDRQRKQYEADIKKLKVERRKAIEEGDVERVETIDDQIDGLRDEVAPPQQNYSQEVLDFANRNPWFKRDDNAPGDEEMSAHAMAFLGTLNPQMSFARRLEMVERNVKRVFPEYFEEESAAKAPVRQAPRVNAVEGGGSAPPKRGNGKTWNDLPEDDRRTAEHLIDIGAVPDRKTYLERYYGK